MKYYVALSLLDSNMAFVYAFLIILAIKDRSMKMLSAFIALHVVLIVIATLFL